MYPCVLCSKTLLAAASTRIRVVKTVPFLYSRRTKIQLGEGGSTLEPFLRHVLGVYEGKKVIYGEAVDCRGEKGSNQSFEFGQTAC